MRVRWDACAAVLLVVAVARADPRADAAAHFRVGIDLVDRKAWDSALAEFERSTELFATSGALENAAVCLRELGRYDEALDAYDALVSRFGGALAPKERAAVDDDVKRIEEHVGAIVIRSAVQGASVLVDGRERGRTPALSPIRVTAGPHVVRVVGEGRAPFEAHVAASAKTSVTVTAELAAVARVGSAHVVESRGRVFEVLVDGGSVGVTPWSGVLSVGDHTFALRGANDTGAEPVTRAIRYDETETVALAAHLLDGAVRVEPDPTDASVWIDGSFVSRGVYAGFLPSGDHTVALAAAWHVPRTVLLHASSDRLAVVRPALESIRRFYGEVDAGPFFADLRLSGIDGCEDASCVGNIGIVRIGYRILPRAGVDVVAGGFAFDRRVSTPIAMSANIGETFYGVAVSYEALDQTPILFRLNVGVDTASATMTSQGAQSGIALLRTTSTSWVSAAIEPEIRIGYRLSRAITIDLGVGVFLLDVHATLGGADPTTNLPIATLSHGLGWIVPITAGFRVFP